MPDQFQSDIDFLLTDEVLACITFLWDAEREAQEDLTRGNEDAFAAWASLYSQVADIIEADYGFDPRPHRASFGQEV